MPQWVQIRQRATGAPVAAARWCASYLCRLRGLMFRAALGPAEALLLVEPADSRLGPSIHMFFVSFPIAAVWINAAGRVVDQTLALPWRPFYAPRAPARYTLEAAPDLLQRVTLGDTLEFQPVASADY